MYDLGELAAAAEEAAADGATGALALAVVAGEVAAGALAALVEAVQAAHAVNTPLDPGDAPCACDLCTAQARVDAALAQFTGYDSPDRTQVAAAA